MLTLQSFRGQNFKFHINRGLTVFRLKEVLSGKVELDFDVFLPSVNMNLQRDLVWTDLQKEQLVISLLKGIQIPNFTFIQYQDEADIRKFQVIDGKQRINTLIHFALGQFSFEWNGQRYFIQDLPNDLRKEIEWYWFRGDVGYEYNDELIPDSEKIRWFELINFTGTPQDVNHLNKLKQAT